jgi:hypothetical protein
MSVGWPAVSIGRASLDGTVPKVGAAVAFLISHSLEFRASTENSTPANCPYRSLHCMRLTRINLRIIAVRLTNALSALIKNGDVQRR